MKKAVFVTGIAGSGKTTLSKSLRDLGYESYDIENDEFGLFKMFRKDTGERFVDYDNSDPEKTKNALWLCDIEKLKELIKNQKENIAFYCGNSSNNGELIPLFNYSAVLVVRPEILEKRLLSREGTDDYGNSKVGRERILNRKSEFEEKMVKAGMAPIIADADSNEVALNLIKLVELANRF